MNLENINVTAWDKRVKIHTQSQFYDIPSFLNGRNSLQKIEFNLLGKVLNKQILHLQCHFGLDTLSLARLGATVTGVDFSQNAISFANELKEKSKLSATFVCADVCSKPLFDPSQFDIVFSSYGVLCWLNDIENWARNIARYLKPGGIFCLVEFHPFHDFLEGYPYFFNKVPDIRNEPTYTENHKQEFHTVATWSYALSELITVLLRAGLQLEHFAEYPFSPYPCFEHLVAKDGVYYHAAPHENTPLSFSLIVRKPKY